MKKGVIRNGRIIKEVRSIPPTQTPRPEVRYPGSSNKFEEEFPSLNIKVQADFELKDLRYTVWTMERLLEDIQEFCLDKQRVRDVIHDVSLYCVVKLTPKDIEFLAKTSEATTILLKRKFTREVRKILLKELGLE